MSRKVLTRTQEQFIVDGYVRRELTQQTLADTYGVSTRTIQRVLIAAGVIPERQMMTHEERRILEALAKQGITSLGALEKRLERQPVNSQSVLKYLTHLPKRQFWKLVSQAHTALFRGYPQKKDPQETPRVANSR